MEIKKILLTSTFQISKSLAVLFSKLVILIVIFGIASSDVYSQDNQVLEFTGESVDDLTDFGPNITTSQIRFLNNTDNPTGNTFENYWPVTTATFILDNFNEDYFHIQNTNNDENNNENPPVIFGWRFGPSTSDVFESPDDLIDYVNFPGTEEFLFNPLDFISSPENSNFVSVKDGSGGIDIEENYGAFLNSGFYGLGDEPFVDSEGNAISYELADLTITLNRPTTNPIIHFVGLGGQWGLSFTFDDGDATYVGDYQNSATLEFELIEISPAIGFSLNKEEGTENFEVDGNLITNNSEVPGSSGEGAAHGSVLVEGEDITELKFRVWVRGTNDPDPLGFGWAAGTGWVAEGTDNNTGEPVDPIQIEDSEGPLENYIASDAIIISISQEVQPDETTLTGNECFRMLSSPVAGTTYGELLAPLWTQGAIESDHADSDQPNIFTWPAGDAISTNNGSSNWIPFTNNLNNTELTPGEGFLMSVFADDFGVENPVFGEKLLSMVGSEHPTDDLDYENTGDSDGWILFGNPYKDPIDIQGFFQNASGLEETVYIWDRNYTTGLADENLDAETFGSWRVSSISNGTVTGDITDDVIMPFQGFFVQKNAEVSTVNFSNRNDIAAESGGEFYGKEVQQNNIVRLEVHGESLYNYMWLRFSQEGDHDRTRGDALAMAPLSTEYAVFGSKKENGEMFTIGHFPNPGEEFEIPVGFETTRPGNYTVRATDFDISFGTDLYFIDLLNNKSIRIDEDFRYDFSTNQSAKTNSFELSCGVMDPQNIVTESSDRFTISTQPKDFDSQMPEEVALSQNYPNPFNPTTQISYELPQQSDVQLVVFDMIGREVATLVNETVQAGIHNVNFDAANLSSGVYIYRLQAGSTVLSRKLTVIK